MSDADGTLPHVTDPPSPADAGSWPPVPGYRIDGELGRGGMGVVYRATQTGLSRSVALKMILSGAHAGANDLARFRAEAEAVARLQHPNIVAVYEVGAHAGRPFFSMEFCPGGSLAARLGGRPLPAAEAAGLVAKVARGVAVAHAAGVVHRDLKPANVLLAADGTPKVTDFGLAKRLDISDGPTASGAVLGTPSYMAPEQALGDTKHVGPAADVYAIGAILYEAITGRPPFRAASAIDTILRVMSEDPPAPRDLAADVPRDLEAVCLKCLDKSPQRRYPTAAALADDLDRFLAGEPVSVQRTGLVDRLAGALDRVQLHARYAEYGSLLLALAPVMLLPEVWVTVAHRLHWSLNMLSVGQFGRIAAFVLVVGYFRRWRFVPQNVAERQLWAIWGGYLVCCTGYGVSTRLAIGLERSLELPFYQAFSCLAGVAFFALAANFWGYCAVIGAAFLGLSFVMALDLNWAPLEFGVMWAAVLVLIGSRLRRLARANAGTVGPATKDSQVTV